MKRFYVLLAIKVVRWTLELALLVSVWRHAYWSVALSITLIGAAVELSALMMNLEKL